ncbi:MAG: Na+/H+ antiporter subunit G [Nitriliruptorales bacterium]|nr:Na+/H+ antiporter subunit G [Nitriliruptorales bacterium]
MTVLDVLTAAALLVGAALSLIAAIGLHRFPDVFARMHAATKPATLGLTLVLGAVALNVGNLGNVAKIILVIALQFLTAPVAAHMVGRAAYGAGTEMSEKTALDELAAARPGRKPPSHQRGSVPPRP